MRNHPAGFMSYVRFDDQHENGRLSTFRERLSGEVRIQTGEEFDIFQDRNDIAWGQQWKQRLDESIDAVTFLIPIITPSFFKSVACRNELERFLEREKRLKRNDLILPVYYVNCPVLNDEEKREKDALARVIAARQYADWRELRFEQYTAPHLGRALANVAAQIVAALERGQAPRKPARSSAIRSRKSKRSAATANEQPTESPAQAAGKPHAPTTTTEAPTLVVDALHRGDYPTLKAALAAAQPGDRILVRPGLYREGLEIDKPVEIIGDGEIGEVVVEAKGRNTILFKATMGRIANLMLRLTGGGKWFCVDIAQGRLDLEDCDISSQSLACVAIHGGADPRLRRNRIHDGKHGGVFVFENGEGTLEDNDIYANALAGIEIKEGGNPTVRRNRIHDGKVGGVYVHTNGEGTLEDNDIYANALSGMSISEGGNPTVRRNRIHDGKQSGVYVFENGEGTLEDNDIYANARSGVVIKGGGNPTVRRNRISNNGYEAIWVYEGGQGIVEDNDLRGNTKGAWDIAPDCLDKVKRVRNRE